MERKQAEETFESVGEACPRALSFPRGQIPVFEVEVSQRVLAVVIPRFTVGIMQYDRVLQDVGMRFAPFVGEGGHVAVKSVLYVPLQIH